MNPRVIGVGVFLLILGLTPANLAQTAKGEREQDHEALRALLRTVTDSINNDDLNALDLVLHDSFSITMVDQAHITSIDEFRAYFRDRFESEGALLESLMIEPTADILTEFVSDTVGVNYGTSVDTYTLKGGRKVVLHSRWTATTVKTDEGWKISTVHAGVNMLDNPILRALEKVRYFWGVGGAVIGLIAGLVFVFVKRAT